MIVGPAPTTVAALKPPNAPQILVVFVGLLWGLEELSSVLTPAVLLRPRPKSLSSLFGFTFDAVRIAHS